MENIAIYYSYSYPLNNNSILYFHGLINEELDDKNFRRITFKQFYEFNNEISNNYGLTILSSLIYTPSSEIEITVYGNKLIHNESPFKNSLSNPYIDAIFKKISNNNDKVALDTQYDKFLLTKFPFELPKFISIQEYFVFKDFLDNFKFDLLEYTEMEFEDLVELIKDIPTIYQVHVLTQQISVKKDIINKINIILPILKPLSIKESQFVYYISNLLTQNFKENLVFYNSGDFFNKLIQYNLVYNSAFSISDLLFYCTNSIVFNLENPYLSTSLINSFNLFFDILGSYYSKNIVAYQKYFLQLIGKTIISLKQNNLQFENLFIDLLLGNLSNIRYSIFEHHTKSENNNELKVAYIKVLELLKDVIHSSEINSTQFYLYYDLHFFINLDPLKVKSDFLNDNFLKKSIVKILEPTDKWPLPLDVIQKIHEIAIEPLIYSQILNNTLLNPDNYLTEDNYKKDYLPKKTKIEEKYKNLFNRIYEIFFNIRLYHDLRKINKIFYLNNPPETILKKIIFSVEDSNFKDLLINQINKKVIFFISTNVNNLTKEIIKQYFSFFSSELDLFYLSKELVIRHLILKIKGLRDLSDRDYFYLFNFLQMDKNNENEKPDDTYFLKLITDLNKINHAPELQIKNSDGTFMNLTTSQTSNEDKKEKPVEPFNKLPLLPSDIFDLFKDQNELENYFKIFFRYYLINFNYNFQEANNSLKFLEYFYYEILQINPELHLLREKFPALSKLKNQEPTIVDDISINFLRAKLVSNSNPTFSIPYLKNIENQLIKRNIFSTDWIELYEFLSEIYKKLNHDDLYKQTQLKIRLLNLYNNLFRVDLFGDHSNMELSKNHISIVSYLKLFDNITIELIDLLLVGKLFDSYFYAVMYHNFGKLTDFLKYDPHPIIELQVMVHLSWDNFNELNFLYMQFNRFEFGLVQELNNNSQIWLNGFVTGVDSVKIRILQLSKSQNQTRIDELYELSQLIEIDLVHGISQSRFTDLVESHLLFLNYYIDTGDLVNLQYLSDYVTNFVFSTNFSNEIKGLYFSKLNSIVLTANLKELSQSFLQFCRLNSLEKYSSIIEKDLILFNKNKMNIIVHENDKTGDFPFIDKIIAKYKEISSYFDF